MKLNTFQLKLIAAILMFIDHIGAFLLPESSLLYLPMRIVGRIAAPLFWYCFTVGLRHTSNRVKYIGRLGCAAIAMGIGNYALSAVFAITISPLLPNIFLTMFLISMMVDAIERCHNESPHSFSFTLHALFAFVLFIISGTICEYGWYAVLSIMILYFLKHDIWKFTSLFLVNAACCWLYQDSLQFAMVLAIPFMMLDSKEKPSKNWKNFFYVFYPTHVWLLVMLSHYINT